MCTSLDIALRGLAVGLVLALAGTAASAATWTVGSGATNDFQSVQVAVNTVAPGDILLIGPGNWGAVTVAKDLSLLGNPAFGRPSFSALTFQNLTRFDATHLKVNNLQVLNVSSRSRLDDCEMTVNESNVQNAGDLVISRSTIKPSNVTGLGKPGLNVFQNSFVQIVDSQVTGGTGTGDDFTNGLGASALSVSNSTVLVAGSRVKGGAGQKATGVFSSAPGVGGVAIESFNSTLDVRGSSFDSVEGGPNEINQLPGGPTAAAVTAFGPTGIVELSGVTVAGAVTGNAAVVQPRPYVEFTFVGAQRRLDVYGGAGNAAVSFLAVGPLHDPTFTPLYGAPLLFHPGTVVLTSVMVLNGQDAPAGPSFVFPQLPRILGLPILAQAGVVDAGGVVAATNSAELILNF